MILKTCWSVVAAMAVSMLFASPACAVDPNLGSGISNPYGVAPYNAGTGFSSTVPIARDRFGNIINGVPVDGLQSLTFPSAIGTPNYSINGLVPVSPISTLGTDPRLNPSLIGTPQQQQPTRWKLGVYSKDTDTGVQIIQVVNGSAAQRSGLEANDLIVSVGGYQVGYVNGQLYDCATEFERSTNEQGWVSMLVQDSRTSRLRNLPVQLESRFSRLSGSIVLNGGQPPVGSYAIVELQEIMRPGLPPVVLTQSRIDNPVGSQIPFSINFDPQMVDTRRTYVLTGRVMSANQTIFAPRNTVQVLAPNMPQTVQLAFDRVGGTGMIGPYAQDAQLTQILALYEQYLNRQPTYQERTVWEADLARGTSLNHVKASIFGQNQFFNECGRDERVYINRLHEINLGRPARAEELAYWMDVYNQRNGVRSMVAQDFLNAVSGHVVGGRVN